MNDNRILLTTNVTDGRTSMLDFTEANSTVNNATINGVPEGTYDVLWENRTLTVTDGNIQDTWQPYEYHFYQLRASDTGTR